MDQFIPLPTVDEYPDADIVLYDGQCTFCTSGVSQIRRLDGKNRLAFLSLHDPSVADRFPDLSHTQLMEQMFVIPHSSIARHGGASAVRYLSRRLPMLWVFAPLLHVPFSLPLWQWLYGVLAQRRYTLAGNAGKESECDGGTCGLHRRR